MHYIGIDLAWTYANESGICVIDVKHQQLIEYSGYVKEGV